MNKPAPGWSLVLLPLLACAARNQPRSPAVVAAHIDDRDLCFGGDPQEVSGQVGLEGTPDGHNPLAPRFQITDGQLVWAMYSNIGKLDLDTLKESWIHISKPMMFMSASHGEVIGVVQDHATTTGNEAFAVNLTTGAERSLLQGGSIYAESLRASTYVVDGDDLYFVRGPFAGSGRKGATLVRLKDRTGEPQVLGHELDSAYTWFRVHDGFVYWNRSVGGDKYQLSRKALSPDAPVAKLAETHRRHVALALAGERAYYLDDGALQSVPLDGSAAPARHADSPGTETGNLVIDRRCAYWTSESGVYRMRLDGQGTGMPEMIVSQSNFGGEHILTDGKHLYWHDSGNNKFKRLSRDARALPADGLMVAKPLVLKSPPADSADKDSTLAVGDGWGCARVVGWGQKHWQCWRAPSTDGAPRGQTVPWLSARELASGPSSLCFLSARADLCWPWPEFTQSRPANLPDDKKQILTGKDGQLLLGGTFACTIQYVGAERMLQCSGDNSFGQRAEGDQPVMLEPWLGGAGTWHGCVTHGKDIYCWGRGDGGQLGAEPQDRCGDDKIPCSRDLHKAVFDLPGVQRLLAGDMFTCALEAYPPRIVCWGASRDGWFGDTDCPSQLREHWPTLSGTVGAPRATCTNAPVEVPSLDAPVRGSSGREISVGPRGMCVFSSGQTHCLGAIPSPSVPVTRVKVSPGARASACGIAGDKVLCWGEDYASMSNPSQPVAIAFASTQPLSAVVESSSPTGQEWPKDKLIQTGCTQPPKEIPKCDPGVTGEPWSSLVSRAVSLRDKPIVVQDRLLVGPAHGKALRWIVLGEGDRALRLKAPWTNPGCSGDESLLCCSLPAFGQRVVAKGKLVGSSDSGWGLWSAELCTAP
jgi:hypothetical protein